MDDIQEDDDLHWMDDSEQFFWELTKKGDANARKI